MKKNICLGAVAVLIVLLMISSAVATPILNKAVNSQGIEKNNNATSIEVKSEKQETNNEIYVSPNILLKKRHLPILEITLRFVKNDQYKNILQQIINVIKEKRSLNSNDLKNILIELGEEGWYWDIGMIKGRDTDLGNGMGYPKFIPGGFAAVWLGMELFVEWTAEGPYPEFKLNDKKINYKHKGVIFPRFIGYWAMGMTQLVPEKMYFTIEGWGFLIGIKRL